MTQSNLTPSILGARAVNLEPEDRPQDVYAAVASIVERDRVVDAAADLAMAKSLDGFIERKVVKQTVMTFVYGVTRYGARLQIVKRLRDIDEFPAESAWSASTYLALKIFASIQEMFTATRTIQDWFTQCAQVISQDLVATVCWVTPLGFPVVQPYMKTANATANVVSSRLPAFLKVCLLLNALANLVRQTPDLKASTKGIIYKPNVMKQKNAFAPNYIHSLDSSHMMLTSLSCEREGVNFVSVHDCYWTHPSTVDVMNRICRKEFVALHSQEILQGLSKNFLAQYVVELKALAEKSPDNHTKVMKTFCNVPKTGSFELKKVLKSTYFFS